MIDSKIQIQEVQRTPSSINTKQSIPRYMIFKLQKIKDAEKDERCQRGKKLNQERNKDKNPMRLLLRNHSSKESRLNYLKVERKNPLV